MAQAFTRVLKYGQEERSIHTGKWRDKNSSMLRKNFILLFVVVRYKMKGFLLGVPFIYIAELSLDVRCARSMLKRDNILVISTGVLKEWDAGPRQIKPSCWKSCEVDHYPTAPPAVFLKVFQFIYIVAKQLFPARCRTLVLLADCYRWCHRSINICDTQFFCVRFQSTAGESPKRSSWSLWLSGWKNWPLLKTK
jgi:hypothetical protein